MQLRQDLRIKLANQSHIIFQEALIENNFNVFKDRMTSTVKAYEETYKVTFVGKVINRLKKELNQILKK